MQFPDATPVLKDRRVDGMKITSAPRHWIEAHDHPFKGEAENEKSAPSALKQFLHPQNEPEIITKPLRVSTVLYFHNNRHLDNKEIARIGHNTRFYTTSSIAHKKIHKIGVTKERHQTAPT